MKMSYASLRREDRASYEFGNLRDDGVAERSHSVCPIGNPIHLSHNSGVGMMPLDAIACAQFIEASTPPFEIFRARETWFGASEARIAVAVGVGHNPYPIASVRGANSGSGYAVPLRIQPERGQISENSVKPPNKECCDVLHDDEAGSYLANKTGIFSPKPRAAAVNAGAFSCNADILAGEPSAEHVGNNSVCTKSLCGELTDVIVDRNSGPMLRQHAPAERIDLAERDRFETPGPFEAQAETAYATEKIEHPKRARVAIGSRHPADPPF